MAQCDNNHEPITFAGHFSALCPLCAVRREMAEQEAAHAMVRWDGKDITRIPKDIQGYRAIFAAAVVALEPALHCPPESSKRPTPRWDSSLIRLAARISPTIEDDGITRQDFVMGQILPWSIYRAIDPLDYYPGNPREISENMEILEAYAGEILYNAK